jgi:hypothetical protein
VAGRFCDLKTKKALAADRQRRTTLLSTSQSRQHFQILIRGRLLQIVEQSATTADHSQQTAARRVILLIGSKMFRQDVDLVGQTGNLNLRRPGIVVTLSEFLTQTLFYFTRNRHSKHFPQAAAAAIRRTGSSAAIGWKTTEPPES